MMPSFDIKIIYDNKCPYPGFLTGFGFSALIYNYFSNTYLLFDTGGDGNTLINNINHFNVNISEISKVIISHNHHDHSGGLEEIFKLNPKIDIYVPFDNKHFFHKAFLDANIHGMAEFKEIEKNTFSSGQFGHTTTREHCLFLKTMKNELIIVVGCAHPGLEEFILKGREITKIKAIIGGFHGFRKFSYLKNIDFIGACHCTQYIEDIKQQFPNQFKRICVGSSFSF